MAVQVVALMLDHAAHQTLTFQHHRLAVEVDAGSLRIVGARGFIPQPWQGKAAFLTVLLTRFFNDIGVNNVADLAVDVVAEHPEINTDLIGRQACATRVIHSFHQVCHQLANSRSDFLDLVAGRAQHWVRNNANLANGHCLPFPLYFLLSTSQR